MAFTISYDIWDTVLRRDVHPDEIKYATALYMLEALELKPVRPMAPLDLVAQRQAIEHRLIVANSSTTRDGDFSFLSLIREQLLESFGISDTAISQVLVQKIEEFECAYEMSHARVDTDIISHFKSHQCKQRIFISDYHHSELFLWALLRHNRLDQYFTHGFVSCDHQLGKSSGRLFAFALQTLGLHPHELVHFGDTRQSDINGARLAKVRSTLYHPPNEHRERIVRHNLWMRQSSADGTGASSPVLKFSSNHSPARCMALLGLAVALKVSELQSQLRSPTTYFVAREGAFFKACFDRWQDSESKFQRSDLLMASRLSTFGPSLQSFTLQSFDRLWSQYREQSVGDFLASLGCASGSLLTSVEAAGIATDRRIKAPWSSSEIAALIANRPIAQRINDSLTANRAALRAYFLSAGFPLSGDVILVDIGWRGTIQDNISYLYPDVFTHGVYLGLFRYLNRQPPNTIKYAVGPNHNAYRAPLAERLSLEFVHPFELAFAMPGGSVREYERETGAPIRVPNPVEERVISECSLPLQDEALAEFSSLAEIARRQHLTADSLRPAVIQAMNDFVAKPDPQLAAWFLGYPNDEALGSKLTERTRHAGASTPALALWDAIRTGSLRAGYDTLAQTGWPQAVLSQHFGALGPILFNIMRERAHVALRDRLV